MYSSELTGKRLEIIKEVIPAASRIGVLASQKDGFAEIFLRETKAVAKELGVSVRSESVAELSEIKGAFVAMVKEAVHAVLVQASPLFNDQPRRVVDLARMQRLPAMFEIKEFTDAGGLMSYGPDRENLFRRAAIYVDKILKGAKPADLPVEQPTKFELVINLKTGKQIGLTIPPQVLARADRVVK